MVDLGRRGKFSGNAQSRRVQGQALDCQGFASSESAQKPWIKVVLSKGAPARHAAWPESRGRPGARLMYWFSGLCSGYNIEVNDGWI